MILTFDTSVLIDIEAAKKETLQRIRELIQLHSDPAILTFIPFFEFYFGIQERSLKNFEKAYSLLQKFPFIQPTKRTAEILAILKKKYYTKGIQLSLANLLIASQVQEHNLLLVTKDNDFMKIEEIKKIVV